MPCLRESTLQGYLEEFGPSPFRQMVESRLASCTRCRAAFDRVVATHRRVNSWLAKLSSPAETPEVDVTAALARVLRRIEAVSTPDDHLARLLAPNTELPWFRSIAGNIRDWIRPEKLPPLELTSKPVAIGDIWGRGANPGALISSFVFQGAIVALLMLLGTNATVRNALTPVTLIAPPVKPAKPVSHQQAGGGRHSPLPALRNPLPLAAPKTFHTPLVKLDHPALVLDSSLIAAPAAWDAAAGAFGNPFAALGGAGGLGDDGGTGRGKGPGIGDRTGDGVDDRTAGIFAVGNGTSKPEVLQKADPEYSEEARKAKYSGGVILSIIVNTDGRATDIKVVKSLGMGLDEKAVEAVQRWLFKPGMNKGAPVRVRAQVEVNFRLL